eukprot:GSChrysophyteH1.ASY1.ANO1.1953.1 assembled CDS
MQNGKRQKAPKKRKSRPHARAILPPTALLTICVEMSSFSSAESEKKVATTICASEDCEKEAKLACPTCIKLGAPPARFCDQDCFKKSWSDHKAVHTAIHPSSMPREFKKYLFTGPLRPWKVTEKSIVPPEIEKPDYADHPDGRSDQEERDKRNRDVIVQYTPEELEGIRRACAVRVGITADELDKIVHDETIKRGAYPSPLNYYNFPKSVCTSVNEIICHGIPDMRPLEDGDIVNLDISVYKDGYHVVQCAYECLQSAIDAVKPGVLYRSLGERIHNVSKKYKCSIVKTYSKGTMKVGHVDDVTWPDGWTACTADGKRSAQFEHTMVVTETGCELLTGRPGEPQDRIVWTREKFQR